MRLDAHLHVWAVRHHDFFWITPGSALDRDFSLEDVRPQLCGVEGAILVQAAQSEAETQFLLQVAQDSDGFVRGVVGWSDLAATDGPERVADLSESSLLVGVRPMIGFIEDTEWLLRPQVERSLQALAARGLTLDVAGRVRHLPLLPALAARHPDLRMVLDHAAKPPLASGWCEDWARGIAIVARETRCFCKLSGLLDGAPADLEYLRPWMDHLLAMFGPERLMWGSDWPVVGDTGHCAPWLAAAKLLIPAAWHDAVFGDTASHFYRLDRQVARQGTHDIGC